MRREKQFMNEGKPVARHSGDNPSPAMVSMIPAGENTNSGWTQRSVIPIKEKILRAESRISGAREKPPFSTGPFIHPSLMLPTLRNPESNGIDFRGLVTSIYSLCRGGNKNPEKTSKLPKATASSAS